MKNYIVARKSIKLYIKAHIVEQVFSITIQKKQLLCLDKIDGDIIYIEKLPLFNVDKNGSLKISQ